MNGKLIVIESGTDASGKTTQYRKLYQRLKQTDYQLYKVSFPDYESESSALVRMYLAGEFGDDPGQVNSYAASAFYAVDRFASFQREWKEYYEEGKIILADRYTTSNMVHQASKIKDLAEKQRFLDWLWDLEFNKFGLPVPDLVIFLDMPPEQSNLLMAGRENKDRDIHERDINYLKETYLNAHWIAERFNWYKINCLKEGKLKSIEAIHEEIYQVINDLLKGEK